ncbi:type 4 prepilin-like proteins leader peptide-processing enzyme [Sporosarcina sp. NCCP-2222]|uniref:prepilin peptidase n=1 Tax=Sporosarcina sp. NCCP-2222 TaxID=2935073 RepID=UPI00208D6CB5|nr:A24 family peptidase [Sporosarcina sp. NCCP-2222]GKV54421.1 type 4 prepilin-like proteins leader peptide-processing enzyme [Sporosarcina sp. NCCP-2222]
MTAVYVGLFFVYGLIFGSFFNVVGLRVPKKESIVSPPSHCGSCGRQLKPLDLIPVLSYIVLGGKCRTCDNRISYMYPVMEVVTGLLFAYSFYHFGWSTELMVAILLSSMLVIITVSDFAYMIIPDKVVLPAAVLFLVLRFFIPLDPWWDSVLGGAIGFAVLFLIAVLSKGGMGGGDIKLFLAIGFAIGTVDTLLTLFLASLAGSIAGIIHLKRTGKGRKTPVPFGPSIALAALVSYFWGAAFVDWYGNLFQ